MTALKVGVSCVVRHALAVLIALVPIAGRADAYRVELLNPDFTSAARNATSRTWIAVGSEGSLWRRAAGDEPRPTEAAAEAAGLATLTRVAFDAQGSVAIAVGDAGTVLRSTDDGRRWQRVAVATEAPLRDVLAIGPGGAEGGVWLAAGGAGVVLHSTDGGRHWQARDLGVPVQVNRLLRDGRGRVWAVGEQALVARSDDGGRQWQRVLHDAEAPPLTGLFEGGGVLLAGSARGRLLRSVDDGLHWDWVQTPSVGFTESLHFDPRRRRWSAITHDGQTLASTDGGRRWVRRAPTLGSALTGLVHDVAGDRLVAVGAGGWLQVSRDGGENWRRERLAGRPELAGVGLEDAGAAGDRLFAWGRFGALYAAGRDGRWRALREALPEPVAALAVLADGRTVLAAGVAGWMARSDDAGAHWRPVPMRFVVDMYPTDFMALSAGGSTGDDAGALLAAGPTGSIMRSDDAGRRWRSVMHTPFEGQEVLPSIVAAPGGVLVVPEMRGGLYRSTDGGREWQRQSAVTGWGVDDLLRTGLASPHDGSLLLVGRGRHLLRSDDAGASWQAVGLDRVHNLFALWADPARPSWWAAGADGALLRSDDGGRQWRSLAIEAADGTAPVASVLLALIRTADGALLAAGRDGVVARSADGERWQRIDSGSLQDLRIAIGEPSGALMLFGRRGTVLRSTDGGRSFTPVFAHTASDFKTAIRLPDGTLLAAGARSVRWVPR